MQEQTITQNGEGQDRQSGSGYATRVFQPLMPPVPPKCEYSWNLHPAHDRRRRDQENVYSHVMLCIFDAVLEMWPSPFQPEDECDKERRHRALKALKAKQHPAVLIEESLFERDAYIEVYEHKEHFESCLISPDDERFCERVFCQRCKNFFTDDRRLVDHLSAILVQHERSGVLWTWIGEGDVNGFDGILDIAIRKLLFFDEPVVDQLKKFWREVNYFGGSQYAIETIDPQRKEAARTRQAREALWR